MLISFALGGLPSNVTLPVTSANENEHMPAEIASADNHVRAFIFTPDDDGSSSTSKDDLSRDSFTPPILTRRSAGGKHGGLRCAVAAGATVTPTTFDDAFCSNRRLSLLQNIPGEVTDHHLLP